MDSLGILGSTGSYAYLTVEERARATRCAVEHAGNIPVIVSIGAMRLTIFSVWLTTRKRPESPAC